MDYEGADLTEEQILDYLKREVGEGSAVPKEVFIIEEIPLTPVGEIFKPALRWDAIRQVYQRELEAQGDMVDSVDVATKGGYSNDKKRCRYCEWGDTLRICMEVPIPIRRRSMAGLQWDWVWRWRNGPHSVDGKLGSQDRQLASGNIVNQSAGACDVRTFCGAGQFQSRPRRDFDKFAASQDSLITSEPNVPT